MGHVVSTVALTEFRRTVRVATANRTKVLLLLGVGVFVLGPITLIGSVVLSRVGEQLAAGTVDGSPPSAVGFVTGAVAMIWLVLVILAAVRTVTDVGKLDEPALLLLATSLRNVVLGLLGAEILAFLAWLVLPTTVLSGAFAYGAGTVMPVVFALLTTTVLVVTAVPLGFLIGIWFRHVFTVYEPVARYRTPVFLAIAVGYFLLVFSDVWPVVIDTAYAVLQDSPLAWPGQLLVVGVPGMSTDWTLLGGGLVTFAAIGAVAAAGSIRSAGVHWYADPARIEADTTAEPDETSRLERLLSWRIDRPTRVVALTTIRRTKRAPIRLVYVAYPLVGILPFLQEIIRTQTIPPYLAVVVCLYVIWAGGAVFTLNLLGDLGRAMPVVVTSPISGRQHVRGHLVAATVLTVPAAVLVGTAVTLASPIPPDEGLSLVVATTVGAVATPALAAGIGSAFPRFGNVRLTSNREAVMPSKTAFLVYSLVIVLTATAGGIVYLDAAADTIATVMTASFAVVPGIDVTVSAWPIRVYALVGLPLGVLSPIVAYGYAVRRFDTFTPK